MKRALHIDVRNKKVTEISVACLEDLQKAVEGYIECGYILENGDELYVNEEGLLNESLEFFFFDGAHQPFAGNGVIIGPVNLRGDNGSAQSSVDEIFEKIEFIPKEKVGRWLFENKKRLEEKYDYGN